MWVVLLHMYLVMSFIYVSCILTIGGDLSPKVWCGTYVRIYASIVSPCDVVQLLNNLAPVRRL